MLSLLIGGYVNLQAQGPLNSNKSNSGESRQISIDEFPTGEAINHIAGWGEMTVAVNEVPAGTDFSPLLEGLKNNSCQVPHWGYIFKGVIKLIYDDGREEVLREGDLFYMSPGHVAIVEEDLKIADFSPAKGFEKVTTHINEKIVEMNKK